MSYLCADFPQEVICGSANHSVLRHEFSYTDSDFLGSE